MACRYLAPVGYLADLRLPVYGFIFRFTMVYSGCRSLFPIFAFTVSSGIPGTLLLVRQVRSSGYRFSGFPDFAWCLTLSWLSFASEFTNYYVWPRIPFSVFEFGRGRRSRRPLLPSHLSLFGTEASADVRVIPRQCPSGSDSVAFPTGLFIDGVLGLFGRASNANLVASGASRRSVRCRCDRSMSSTSHLMR